ncbi:MAG: hypothetical protein PVF79_18120 [Desulfobacterales bacterium]|jgi:hypothetical protein
MNKLAILYTIAFLSTWSPLQATEETIRPGDPIDKLIKEKGDIQLRRCGVGFVEDKGIRKRIGRYKINIGNPLKIRQALKMNIICGFDGWIFAPKTDDRSYWYKIRIHRAQEGTRSREEKTVISKQQLPAPYNGMPDKLLAQIEFFNIYPENDRVTVVYLVRRTALSDCETIFDYIYHKHTT